MLKLFLKFKIINERSSFDFKSKYDTLLKENTTLQNKIKVK